MNAHTAHARFATSLGDILLAASGDRLVYAQFVDRHVVALPAGTAEHPSHPVLMRAHAALERYFACGVLETDIELAPAGTPFQRDVWRAITTIPARGTVSYAQIAAAIEAPRAARAVGAATGRNPLCVFVPCHRVLGSRGALTGYAGGIARKRALLELEARAAPARKMQAPDPNESLVA